MDSAAGGRTATTLLVAFEGAALYSAFLPSWFTISSPFFHEQGAKAGNVRRIRQGEVAATVLNVGIGWAAARLVGSPWPLIGAAAISVVMIVGYEHAMNNPATQYADGDPHRPAAYNAVRWRSEAP